MAYYPVTGSRIFIQSAIATAKSITALNNTNPPAATSVGHGYAANDELLVLNGWEDTNASVFRIGVPDVDHFTLVNFDATNTDWYPAGAGVGSAQKITTWTPIGQVLGVQNNGGNARFVTVQPIDRRNPINIPVGFDASSMTLELGYDPAQAAQVEMLLASRSLAKRAIKFVLPGGGYAYSYGTVSLSNLPTFDTGGVMKVSCALSMDGIFTKY
jgi:hypothetical protein